MTVSGGAAENGRADEVVTLAIDASTYAGSVAVLRGARVVAERTAAMRGENEERLMPATVEVLAEAGVRAAALSRVVCGAGPGSFTSLRIAASIAKGVAQGADLSLFAVPSTALVVAGAGGLPNGRYVVALDAARGEWFAALAEKIDGAVTCGPTRLVSAAALADVARAEGARVIGPAAGHGGLFPHARGVAGLESLVEAVDLAVWEPDYGRLAEAQVKWEAQHGRPLPRA